MVSVHLQYSPIYIYLSLWLSTWGMYWVGPIRYVNFNIPLLLSFLVPVFLLTLAGFYIGVRGAIYPNNPANQFKSLVPVFRPFFLVSAVMYICQWVMLMLTVPISEWLLFGKNYLSVYGEYQRGASQLSVGYILGIFQSAIFTISAIGALLELAINERKKSWIIYFILISYVSLPVIATGKMKYVGDLFVFGTAAMLVGIATGQLSFNFRRLLKLILATSTILLAMAVILASRYAEAGTDVSNIFLKLHPLMRWDEESLFVGIFGEVLGLGFAMLTLYFTIGSYGLSICLDMPFQWTYFLGSSYSVGRIFERLLGKSGEIVERAYPMRAEEYGWGMDKWHTVYSWLASDFTFFGALMISFFVAILYGRVWRRVLDGKNPCALPLFLILTLGMVFSLANNQLLHSASGVMVVLFFLLLYVVGMRSRGKA